MKKALIIFITLIAVSAIYSQTRDFPGFGNDNIQELVQWVAAQNSQTRDFSFNFDASPYNLPDSIDINDPETGIFFEDEIWTKDFSRHIDNPENIPLSLSFYEPPEHFNITQPDPENPFTLQFEPIPENWHGSELLIIIASDVVSRTEVMALIRINVTPVPDPPVWAGLPPNNTFTTDEETSLQINFQDYVTCIDAEPAGFDLFIDPAPYPVDVTQSPTPTGYLVTFTPQQDYNGTAIFDVTAVDTLSNAYSTVQIQLEVLPVNDPPQIVSYQPPSLVQDIDQGASISFSVEVQDVENDPLSYTWTLSGLDNGVPYSDVVSTSDSLDYVFDLPGTHTLDLVVSDGTDSDSLQWTMNVSPWGPDLDPLGGTYTNGVNVVMSLAGIYAGAVIHYTVDGSTPTQASPVYTEPVEIPAIADEENVVNVQAFFVHPDYPPSQITSQTYVITGQVSDPVLDPPGGLYYTATEVSMSCSNTGATIHYTLDGSTPVPGNGQTNVYDAPILIPAETSMTLKALATRDGWLDSNVVTQDYQVTGTVTIDSLTLTPPPLPDGEFYLVEPGEFITVAIDSLAIDPIDATLYYTLDNSTPGPDNPSSFVYTTGDQIPLDSPTWITFRAYLTDWLPSETFSHYYDVRTRTTIIPFGNGTVFDPAPGYSTTAISVSISTQTNPAGAAIYFTTDGSDPIADPMYLYTDPISVSETTTIKAIAQYPGLYPSEIHTGSFTITGTVDAPTFDPLPGSYENPVDLVISTALSETSIYYTLDGTEPSDISPTSILYTGPVALGVGEHYVKSRAYRENWDPSPISEGAYNIGILPAPEFDLEAGTYFEPIVVHLSVPSVTDALIYYTTDGSDPSVDSILYDPDTGIPIGLETSLTIKAIAWKAGWQNSPVASRSYQVTGTVATPTFDPDGGVYPNATDVTIATTTPDAVIRYTLDGVDPTEDYGTLYTDPVTISSSTTLKARAFRTDWQTSDVYGAVYTIFGNVADPVFTPGAGTYTSPIDVYISVNPPDATVYYTMDGSVPSSDNGLVYTPGNPINISSDTLLRAIGIKTGWNPSAVVDAQYYITGTVSTPAFDPPSGQYAVPQSVTISADPSEATIIYTLDGSEPSQDNGTVYDGAIDVASNTVIKAFAYIAGWEDSQVATASYIINGPIGTPVINPPGGYYNSSQSVSISVYPSNATIRYTLDGSIPSPDNGFTYVEPFVVDEYALVQAYAYLDNWLDSDMASAEYFFVVGNPVLSLPSGIYADAQELTITVPTPGASIRYTTDGSDPSPEAGTLYEAPISIDQSMTVKAIAYRENWISSSIVSHTYVINGPVADPIFSVAGGDYYNVFSVGISTVPSNATIYYTTDGTDPSQFNGTIYAGPVAIDQNTVLKARAYLSNWLPSNVSMATYDLHASPVSFSPGGGTYTAAQNVSLQSATANATISYTLDGSDPIPGVSPVFDPLSPIVVDQDLMIKAIASRANWHSSEITSADYIIDIPLPTVETPQIQPPGGIYEEPQTVTITTATPGATIVYTTDGSDPSLDNGEAYLGGFVVSDNVLIKARAYKDGYNPSQIASVQYIILIPVETVATPTFSPPAGIYDQAIQVSISTLTPQATIRYTLDGTEPSETIGEIYTGPINISETVTIKAIAYKTGMNTSLISNASYVIDIAIPEVAAPMFSHPSGTYYQAIDLAISTTTENASIRYTTDGSVPTPSYGIIYTDPINIPEDSSLFIQAIAYRDGWTPSPVVSASYTVTGTVTEVIFTPEGGIFAEPTPVVLTTPTLGATIRYTTDGSTPTEDSSLYTTAIVVPLNSTMTISARAFKTGWLPSDVTQQTYTVTGQVVIYPPVFSLPEGIYQTAQTVSINTSTTPTGATVRYTTDGSTPTETSPVYSAPIMIPLNTTMTIKAVAFLDNWVPSIVYEATYTVTGQVILPDEVFTPPAGTYQSAQSITLDTNTTPSGATLRYTLDDSEPTENSQAYTTPINLPLNSTTTIKVKGFKTNWIPSETETAQYVITGQVTFQTPVFSPPPGTYSTPQTVTVSETFPDDAVVYYTTDGSEPTATASVYTDPILIGENTTLKVKAFKTDWIASVTHTGVYTITGQASIASPVFAPDPGTYQTEQTVSINTQTVPDGAQIRYTMDGSDPNASSTLYTTPIELELNNSYEIRARAFATDWTPSEVYVAQYTLTGEVEIPAPVFTPAPGIYTNDISVVLNTQTLPAGAILRYSLDGNDPDESYPQYTQPVQLEAPADVTLKVRAYKDDWLPSQVYAAEYTLTGQMQLLPPYLDPPPGIYTTAQSVSPAGGTAPAGSIIRFTTDGSDPTQDSPVFDGPIEIGLNNVDFTIKIRAFKENWIPSAVHTGVYTVTGQVQLADDMFSPDPGTYTHAVDVSLDQPVMPDNATMRYTMDGSEPTTGSPAYSSPIALPLNVVTTIKVKGFSENWIPSETATAVYSVTGTVAQPAFDPPGGTYGEALSVSITTSTEGAQIHYTLDGSEPTQDSELYTEPIAVADYTQDLIITARAFKDDWESSPTGSATYSVLSSPVDVRAFTYAGYIRLLWNIPQSQRILEGFNVYRRALSETEFVQINETLVNTQIDGNYYFDDYNIAMNESYEYYVTAVYDGAESPPSVSTVEYYQSQNLDISDASCAYPNPAENSATLKIVLNRNDNVQIAISIYDFSGKKIRTLTTPVTNSNLIEIPWDLKNYSGNRVGRGTYFARVIANDSVNRSEYVIKIAVK